MRKDHADRARALIGTRFRPQGRAPATGLDCVGLVLCTFGIPEADVRRDYRLRGDHRREVMTALAGPFRRIPRPQSRAGDVLVFKVSNDQLHLAILTPAGFVHADARRGRVVETPGAAPWPVIAAFRRRSRGQGQG